MKNILLTSALVLATVGGAHAGGNSWSSSDENQLLQLLARKAANVLPIHSGEPYLGYAGRETGHQALPPGCTEQKKESNGEVFVFVNCPGKQPPPGLIAVPYNGN